jgi:hypothetical protein
MAPDRRPQSDVLRRVDAKGRARLLSNNSAMKALDGVVERAANSEAVLREHGLEPAQSLLDKINVIAQTLDSLKKGNPAPQ